VRQRKFIIYAALLLVPTLAIGLAAIRLLRHEQDRLQRLAVEAIEKRLQATASDITLAVSEAENSVLRRLATLPEAELGKALRAWQSTDPLVRQVFIWDPAGRTLVLPDPSASATADEQLFMRRYEGLFSGRVPWQSEAPEGALPAAALGQTAVSQPRAPTAVENVQDLVARNSGSGRAGGGLAPSSRAPRPWITWFAENELHLLGWTQVQPDGPIYGVEMEMMILLGQLAAALPVGLPPGETIALLDGSGGVLQQSGALEITAATPALVRVPVGPLLPHWELAAYVRRPLGPAAGQRAFLVLAGLLTAIFVSAILVGGALLWREAYRSHLDARQKTSFVANVSHELKTPLTTIRMYAELLSEGRIQDASRREHYLDTIVAESQRLTRLINNVLDFSRLEQGRKEYHPEWLDLGQAVATVLDTHAVRLAQAGLRLECSLPTAPLRVRLDRDALEQVLLNLIDNAIKYASDGKELEVRVGQANSGVSIEVLDRGPGVPASARERVFEKFQRLDSSLTARRPGCGLGLTIARKMMRDLGGDVVCRERPGGGACFAVLLAASSTAVGSPPDSQEGKRP
jgi:signal transduction histidine kinase